MNLGKHELVNFSSKGTRKNIFHSKKFSLNLNLNPNHTREDSENRVQEDENFQFSVNRNSHVGNQRRVSERKVLVHSRSCSKDNRVSLKQELSPEEQDRIEKIIQQKLSLNHESLKSSLSKKILSTQNNVLGYEINALRSDSLAAVQAKKVEKLILPQLRKEALTEVMLDRKIQSLKSKREVALAEMENIIVNKHTFVPTKLFSEGSDNNLDRAFKEAHRDFRSYAVRPIQSRLKYG